MKKFILVFLKMLNGVSWPKFIIFIRILEIWNLQDMYFKEMNGENWEYPSSK